MNNLFSAIPDNIPTELVDVLVESAETRIERIVSLGHASDVDQWYDQEQHEFVIVLKGAARIQFEDRMVELKAGDWLNIPAHQKHRVDWTSPQQPTIWLAMFYTPGGSFTDGSLTSSNSS